MKLQECMDRIRRADHRNIEKDDPSYVRVMTSNILHSRASEQAKKTWEDRINILAALYLTFKPDFLGLQEVSFQQGGAMAKALEEVYASPNTPLGDYVNFPYHGADYIQNHVPIFYNKKKYEVLDSRYHLFEDRGLFGYQWALYRSLEHPEQKVIHMNLHFYSGEYYQRQRNALEAHHELVHLLRHYPTTPIFLTGDYNMIAEDESFRLLLEDLPMRTAMHLTDRNDNSVGWAHDLGSMNLWMAKGTYDHVSVTTELCDVMLHRVLYDELIVCGTDHSPMFVDLKLK